MALLHPLLSTASSIKDMNSMYTCHPIVVLSVFFTVHRRTRIHRNAHWNKTTLRSYFTNVSPNKSISFSSFRPFNSTTHYNYIRSMLEIVESGQFVQAVSYNNHQPTPDQETMKYRNGEMGKQQTMKIGHSNAIYRGLFDTQNNSFLGQIHSGVMLYSITTTNNPDQQSQLNSDSGEEQKKGDPDFHWIR